MEKDVFNLDNIVIFMQGCSGSGKSSFVEKYYKNAHICSADLYFSRMNDYKFDYKLLSEAHKYCFNEFVKFLQLNDNSVIIVDNTNTTPKEIKIYVDECKKYNKEFIIIYKQVSSNEAHYRNQHNVPYDTVLKQAQRINTADWFEYLDNRVTLRDQDLINYDSNAMM